MNRQLYSIKINAFVNHMKKFAYKEYYRDEYMKVAFKTELDNLNAHQVSECN